MPARQRFFLLLLSSLASCTQTPAPISFQLDSTWPTPQHVRGPYDLKILPDNTILVSDSALRCVFVYNDAGEELLRITHLAMRHPTALAALSTQNFFVADIKGNSLLRFNRRGEFINRFGDEGKARGLMLRPAGLSIAPDSTLWMTELGNRRVQAFGEKSNLFYGVAPTDSLRTPRGIVVARDGSVYFTDSEAARVWHISADAKILGQWGAAQGLQHPTGIALDAAEQLYVADEEQQCIFVYSAKGKQLAALNMSTPPIALAFDSRARLYVLSKTPPGVQRFIVR